jgi:predicted nucleic acid-binding protein
VKGIADTGFLVAFANRRDRHHAWAVRLAAEITAPLLTCEAVLAESAFHLRDTHLVLEMVATGLVTRAFNLAENLDHLAQLAQRYADREPDLADLCLIRMSELHLRHVVVTVDRTGLRVYRRNKRDAIPLACPTER